MSACEKCADYLAARRTVLLPHVGRWVQRHDRSPSVIVAMLAVVGVIWLAFVGVGR